ncbi:Uma2 family endonuclease [Acaryochloris sp. IP29b_bin.148]|uniref:Uma2 family endonuclease n=1 Tax=Acaryochloris sp. IP29b_bin.148 TaxID=2969218 RepID=UPI00261DF491|nr:Uma2 family endonuclease [Acaryochloris sp. IP29b_bin.148]
MTTYTVNLKPALELTDEQFWQICVANRDLKFERSAAGELIIMPPTGGTTGNRNSRLNQQLCNWADQDGMGLIFDSSTGFKLPNGADRSPDAAWVRQERWDALTTEQQDRFVPLCPDFVVEILSPSDRLQTTQAKMQEYIDNGTQLGWLINRKEQQVEIYRPGQTVEVLDAPQSVAGEPVLPGFRLNLGSIW